ncbi:MAG: anti-sigma factor [Ignavibacteria bacterium]
MDDQKFQEIVYAYSAGCLDKEDYPGLFDYLNSGNVAYNFKIGQLQNVISLLPAVLEIEYPDQMIKDKIARKLYKMHDEIRTTKMPLGITATAATPEEITPPAEEKHYDPIVESKVIEIPPRKRKEEVPVPAPIHDEPVLEYSRNITNENRHNDLNAGKTIESPAEQIPPPQIPHEIPPVKKQPDKQAALEKKLHRVEKEKDEDSSDTGSGFATILIALIFALITAGTAYYLLSKEIKKNKDQITSLNDQVGGLNEEVAKLNKNQRILALIGARDVKTFNLDGTLVNPKGFGKLVVTSENREGIIQLYNMPRLSGAQVYKLWIIVLGQSLPVGTFRTKRDVEYFPIDQFPVPDPGSIESIIVTLEAGADMPMPSQQVYLSYNTAK